MNIGLDVYPIQGQSGGANLYDYDDDSHQVKLHLNLFSNKPQKSYSDKIDNISLGPFSFNTNG